MFSSYILSLKEEIIASARFNPARKMIPDTDDGSAGYMPFTRIAKYIAKAR